MSGDQGEATEVETVAIEAIAELEAALLLGAAFCLLDRRGLGRL